MTIHVDIDHAKTRLSELIAAVRRGEEVVLDEAGKPQVKLVPVADAESTRREQLAAKRAAGLGIWADKYRHLHGSEALDVPPLVIDCP